MIDLHRFEDQVEALERYPAETGKVLLYGSSFFAKWGYVRANSHWQDLTNGAVSVVNHGFGGATVEELLYYYHRLVTPYAPSAVVFRTGLNDLYNWKPGEGFFLTQRLFDWVKNDYPGIHLIAIKCFDTPFASEAFTKELWRYNQMLEELAEKDTQLYTVDLDPFVYKTPEDIGTRKNFRDIFCEDGLHLTDSGYEQMAQYLIPKVLQYL